jgi:hypothetical protein
MKKLENIIFFKHLQSRTVTTSAEVVASPCSGGACSGGACSGGAFDVTDLLAIIDPFLIFHLFCLVFPHTSVSPHVFVRDCLLSV